MTLSSRYVNPALAIVVLTLGLSGCPFGDSGSTRPAPTSGTTVTNTASVSKPATSSPVAPTTDPTQASFQQALQLMKTRDYTQAEPLLSGLTRQQPQLAGPWLNLGILYARTNRSAEAIKALRHGLGLNPGSAAAQNQLGILLREAGNLRDAEQAYQAALSASPNYANAHLNLGVLYDVYLKQPTQALKHYEQYQRLAPADSARVAVWIAGLQQRNTGKP